MSNYTKTTNFAAKDSLPSGNAAKIVKGAEIDTEFNNIATASATKADIAGPTFTGTVTIPTVDLNGGAIDGTTVGASTAAAITGTTIVANTSINIAGDGATVTGIKDEDDMSSNSATKLATQQSIKAYVDSQVTAQDLDFQADSGGALSIDLDSETLTFTGGTGVDTSGSGNAVTFAIDSTVTTLTGTQTLTNKTLTSPTLNTPTIGTSFTIGSATITEAELEILDGATVTTAELNVLDGITSTTAELNILDGVTSTAAELNILDGVTSTTAELNILDGVTSTTAELNILDGVTSTTAELNLLDGVTSTTAELNILDGVTSTAAELNILDGVTATTAELNYVDGVTSAIQTQLDAKAPLASPTFTGTVTVPGLTTTADISFADNDKAIFGAGSDLQIYHSGSASFISDQGTGHLKILAGDFRVNNAADNAQFISAVNGAEVTLYHNNAAKLATTATGIDVTGAVNISGSGSGTEQFRVGNSGGGTDFGITVTENSGVVLNAAEGSTARIMSFATGGTERARITAAGEFCVGGVINAGLTDNGFFVGGTDGINVYSVNSSTSSSTYHVYDNGGGAYKFFVTYAGTINATGTTIAGISDIRWKENIRDLDDGLSKVMQLQPRKFDWKEGKGKDVRNDRGFIAQEFETVFPDLIDDWIDPAPEGEEPYKAVRADLIPTLVKAIQEQQAIIEALTARVAQLEQN